MVTFRSQTVNNNDEVSFRFSTGQVYRKNTYYVMLHCISIDKFPASKRALFHMERDFKCVHGRDFIVVNQRYSSFHCSVILLN